MAAGCNMKETGREIDQHGEANNRNSGALNVGNSLGNPNLNVTNVTTSNATNSGLRVVDEAEDKVQNIQEVKHADIIAANGNAYVAVVINDDFHGEMSPYMEDQIAQQVRNTDTTIQNVYISSNHDVVSEIEYYKDQIQNGRLADEINDGFNEMVHRVFHHHERLKQD